MVARWQKYYSVREGEKEDDEERKQNVGSMPNFKNVI